MCLRIVIKIIFLGIIGNIRGISLFKKKSISQQYNLLVIVAEQRMPNRLDKEEQWSKVRKNRRRERTTHFFIQLISMRIIVEWIHMEAVPWYRD